MIELFATTAIWGLSFALAKKALNRLHPLELVTLRLFLGAVTATIIGRLRNRPNVERRALLPILLGVFEFAGTYILYTWSLKFLPSGVVGTLTLSTSALIFVVALVAGVQKFRVEALAGTVLSIVGAFFCLPAGGALSGLTPSSEALIGGGLIMASNLMFAIGNVAISKFQVPGASDPNATASGLWIGALLSAIVCAASGAYDHPHELSVQALALPLYLGIVPTGLGFTLWNQGVEKTSALKASFIFNFKAPLALICGWLLLGEKLNPRLALGLVLLVLATRMIRKKPQTLL